MRELTGKGVKLGGGGAWLRCCGGQGRPAAALCNIVDFTACFQFICPIVCVCIAAADDDLTLTPWQSHEFLCCNNLSVFYEMFQQRI